MAEFDYRYDDIYGIKIDEYMTRHGTNLEELISKTEMDIVILKENQNRVYEKKLPYPESHLETIIYQAIKKKEEHLEDLRAWEADGKNTGINPSIFPVFE